MTISESDFFLSPTALAIGCDRLPPAPGFVLILLKSTATGLPPRMAALAAEDAECPPGPARHAEQHVEAGAGGFFAERKSQIDRNPRGGREKIHITRGVGADADHRRGIGLRGFS